MNKKVKLTLLAVASCCFAGLIVYIVTTKREADKNLALVRSNLHQAVENAKKGDRKDLNAIIEAIARGDKRYVSDKLLPDYTSFLKDTDGQIQLLGSQGLYGVKNQKSKEPLVNYLKGKDFTKMEEKLRAGQFDEQQAEWQGRASSIAILTLGETGDKSVIPLLESLRGVRDLQFEWGGSPVEQALSKLGAEGIRSLSNLGPNADMSQISHAAGAIRIINDPKSVPQLIATVKDPKCAVNIRAAALDALAGMKDVDMLPFILETMKDPKYPKTLRESAAEEAGRTHRTEAEKALLEMLTKHDCDIRIACLYGLAKLNSERYIHKILNVVLDKSAPLAERIELAKKMAYAMQPKELAPHAEMLRMGIKAVKEDNSPADDIRVDMWMALNIVTGEEPPLELMNDKTAYMWMRDIFRTKFIRENVHDSAEETRRKVDEKIKSIVVKWQPEKGGEKQ